MSDIVPDVLELLVCPRCRHRLAWAYEAHELQCTNPQCGLAYPVRGGIPILIEDEARGGHA
ncbi:Trm112 family protein [Nigerium sp.]|jgi:uncharacterized protein YbaR (Trm112 family)|uniref:Trm112 family protein n=1 Tax=Nigerium sp. TaxID=2042655 RepID=UPI0032220C1D